MLQGVWYNRGRKAGGGFRTGTMERDCTKQGTPVLISEGFCVKIETMKKYNNVFGWCSEQNGIIVDEQTNFAHKGKRMCYQITLKDGRTINATKHHPFLVDGEWVELNSIRINEDCLETSISGPTIDIDDEIKICNNWILDLGELCFTTNTFEQYMRTLAFSRIIGLTVTDGHIPKKGSVRLYMGHLLDVESVKRDLKAITDADFPHYMTNNTYSIHLGKTLSNVIRGIRGVVIGAKIDQKAILPSFLFQNCPVPIIREFLGGYFGGDGHTCCISMHRGKRDVITSISVSETKVRRWVPSLVKKLGKIKKMLERCGVTGATIQQPKETTNSKSVDNRHNFEVNLYIPLTSLIPFSEKIGFRYCVHKSIRMEAGVSYRRFREKCLSQRLSILNRIRDLKNEGLSMTKGLAIAVVELEEKEPVLHKKSIPSYGNVKLFLKGKNGNTFRRDFPSVEEYFAEIGALKFFSEKSSSSIRYGVHRDNQSIPTFSLKVIDIRPIGMYDVYDITVKRTHSFIANGIVSHNCILANGCPSFVRDRLMEQSDEYKMYFCKICGLPALAIKGDQNIPPTKECSVCQSNQIAYVRLPYATKLLMYEFMGMGMVFRVLTDKFNGSSKLEATELEPRIMKRVQNIVKPIIEEVEQAYQDSLEEEIEEPVSKPLPKPKRRKRKMNVK